MDVNFEYANVPIAVAAKALKIDCQTLRLLLQNGLVSFGMAYKRPGSKRFSYLIYAKQFYEMTGFHYQPNGEAIE